MKILAPLQLVGQYEGLLRWRHKNELLTMPGPLID